MILTIQQQAIAYKLYKEHLVDNFKASELAEMLMAKMTTQELDNELQNVVELCEIEEDGTY
jgi:hypothetical protein